MSVEIAWKQKILVTDFHLLKSLLVVLGFGSQAFVCGFSRQNINSEPKGVPTSSHNFSGSGGSYCVNKIFNNYNNYKKNVRILQ